MAQTQLAMKKKQYERSGMHAHANALPTHIYGAMTMLESHDLASWPVRYLYDQCVRCHFLYRRSHLGDHMTFGMRRSAQIAT
eukprot:365480-Chlamydomonas_euryale.AAC.2